MVGQWPGRRESGVCSRRLLDAENNSIAKTVSVTMWKQMRSRTQSAGFVSQKRQEYMRILKDIHICDDKN